MLVAKAAPNQPVLLPAFTLVAADASQVPPVAFESLIDKYVTVVVPEAFDMVACVPDVELVKYFSVVPVVTKEPTVVVVLAGSCNVPVVNVSAFDKVVAPENAKVPPVPDSVIAYKVLPADVSVAVPEVFAKV